MAEVDAAGHAAGKGLDELVKAKIGPVPIWVVGVAGLALWWWTQHKGGSASSNSAVPNQQKDPAGNIGSIDPATGYVYGTPEDTASLTSNNAGTGGDSSSGGGSTTAGQYATDSDWGRAAINYLVGLGVDPTTANQAIEQFLSSQTLTTEQQGDVNLAIQGLGAPPQPPTASQTNPTPVVGGGSGGSTTSASNPPTGLAVGNVTNSTIGLKWNAVANATGYTISYGTDQSASTWSTTAPGSGSGATSGQVETPGVTIGNLTPGTTYWFKVQGTPVGASGGWAGPISASTQGTTAQQSNVVTSTKAASS